jgi:heme exporter protein B
VKSFLTHTWTIAAKDLRAELRTKEALNASLAFSVVILVLFSFAIDPSSLIPDPIHPLDNPLKELSGGLLWLVYAFAGALILNRSFARELQNDCLDALIAAPLPPGALFLGKALANFALLMAIELIAIFSSPSIPNVLAAAGRDHAGNLGDDRDRHHLQRAHRESAIA